MHFRLLFAVTSTLLAYVPIVPAHSTFAVSQRSADSLPESLFVDTPPSYLRPYVIPHYASAHAVTVGSQTYRFYVTGPSSNYAFTLMGTNAPYTTALGVLPHIHYHHYENFFTYKGRVQLWAQKDNATQQSRVLYPGDYGSVVRNTTHTFQILDPDTELVGAIVPGGFEELFYYLGSNLSTTTHTPYVPQADDGSSATGPNSSIISSLTKFDVHAQLDFEPRRDAINGTAPASNWHTGNNTLTTDGSPYFVANGWGPKYINSQYGYQIVQPLATPAQTQDTNFTLSTISISTTPKNITIPQWSFPGAAAFQVLEGNLKIQIAQYPTASLSTGDVAFVPGNLTFKYWSGSYFTKFLFLSSGKEGLDQKLIQTGAFYDYVTFPTTW
ncbi:quercetin 2,3-dioxygenase anaerobically complexed with the substrate kaempferol [Paecilomyces variotii]|uniref:Quercetin 2,3-dioxygenase anaerobically complexed with the substrate kaempferol n=1 Tax=Byssochlamys spectabilis TaxID=264951 RepID=A0A443HVP0_BYSSP|nr:quercetin 2,3-dioxygenase anaerobically complexed with the substrate kaempferol [Paecilomyces variotii]KAJ9363658.1 hypothetical protein DTO280E4_2248 [Paecilomyces variotii]KAJ9386352.1 hypothetical protein DTO063F5_3615 [Paecilomyces variotii]RWQ95903.1 quercetin 2,3-dioxygenase anaerobically complexed with the substrate kaempferol [Paecilomyces variotii]